MTLTEGQEAAVELVRRVARGGFSVSVIAGAAGTGKTTALKEIVRGLLDVRLLAPTGRAARRAQETSDLPASTIHGYLYTPILNDKGDLTGWERKDEAELSQMTLGPVVVDEASMLGRQVYDDLRNVLRAIDQPLILMGDPYQLPPVAGKDELPFSALGQADRNQRVELDEVLRQAQDSLVLRVATDLRKGRWSDSGRILRQLPIARGKVSSRAMDLRTMSALGGESSGVIVHSNATRRKLNMRLRELLELPADALQQNEPILIRRNHRKSGLMNGDVVGFWGWTDQAVHDGCRKSCAKTALAAAAAGAGVISAGTEVLLDENFITGGTLEACSKHRRWHTFLHAELGYTMTAHSAQGSEWDEVLVVVEPTLCVMPQEERMRWLYTAVTRARKSAEVAFLGR